MDRDELGYKVSNASFWVLVATLVVVPMVLAWPQITERSWFGDDGTYWVAPDGHTYREIGKGVCVAQEEETYASAKYMYDHVGEGLDYDYEVQSLYSSPNAECVSGMRVRREDGQPVYVIVEADRVEQR